ncbi:MAG: DNA topology modulation protein [Verrucomicrobiota bacterium]
MNRVMIIGSGGAGKSTLAKKIETITKLPLVHLDQYFWLPGWKERPTDEWRSLQETLCAEPRWIIDGNYGGTMDLRLAAADTIIFLDANRWLCLYRVLLRTIKHLGRARPDMPKDCPERFTYQFLSYIFNYPRTRRLKILNTLESLPDTKEVLVLKSKVDISNYLASLDKAQSENSTRNHPPDQSVFPP